MMFRVRRVVVGACCVSTARTGRADLLQWGYCLVEEALSQEQVAQARTRVLEQAEGRQSFHVMSDNLIS